MHWSVENVKFPVMISNVKSTLFPATMASVISLRWDDDGGGHGVGWTEIQVYFGQEEG